MLFVILLVVLLACVYVYLKNRFNYWSKRDVPNPPVNILFGNFLDVVTLKKSLGQTYSEIYNKYRDLPYVGFYKNRNPGILLRDPELIKEVLVKDFSSFHDNDIEVDPKVDPLFGRNAFTLKGDQWKIVRQQLVSCFSTAKIKAVYPLIQDTCKNMVAYLEKNEDEATSEDGIEAKNLATNFTTDNVASCAFGLQGRCFEDPKAEFKEIGVKIFNPCFTMALKHLVVLIEPGLAKVIDAKFFPDDVSNRLRQIVKDTFKYREANKIVRNDFLDILKVTKEKSREYKFTDEDITAQVAGFFGDGTETSSIALSFALHEIAANPLVQDRLKKEIDAIADKHNGEITYEAIHEMEYLDCVMNESFRKYSAALYMARVCTSRVTLPNPRDVNKPPVTIEPGTTIIIPIYALHWDEKYFPNPEKFDPERFSPENKPSITKFTYMPFGDGPRICLGIKFGVLQVKTGIITIVKNFEMRVSRRTKSPLEIDPKYFMLAAKDGIWLNFYKRKVD